MRLLLLLLLLINLFYYMVFPTNYLMITPCLTSRLSSESREVWKERYRCAKKYVIRVAFGTVTGNGCYTIIKEAAIDGIKCHGKLYMGAILTNSALTTLSVGVPLLTNSTKVVKYSRAMHSACAAAWRASHNIAELPLLICDYLLFGEAVPSCGEADYDIFSNKATDFINEFTK